MRERENEKRERERERERWRVNCIRGKKERDICRERKRGQRKEGNKE
jgi:hypothetical protein